MGTFEELWNQVAEASPFEKGDRFEELCKWFLENDPVYKRIFSRVYRWAEWPKRWGPDNGIDLIGETPRGEYWAVQAKGYAPSTQLNKSDIDSFLSEATRPIISNLLLITSLEAISPKVQSLLAETEKSAEWLTAGNLRERDLIWPSNFKALKPVEQRRKMPRPHQQKAVDNILEGFKKHNRGQAIMACGTGKTFTSILAAEALNVNTVLVLVPSIWLVSQTLSEWVGAWKGDLSFLAVCSDQNAGRGSFSRSAVEGLGVPSVTDPEVIRSFCKSNMGKKSVIFCTYHSSPAVTEAISGIQGFQFDLVIADEAHRTATSSGNAFTEIHEGLNQFAQKILFMTATPRVIGQGAAASLLERGRKAYSMSDPSQFGPVFHELPFSNAIEQKLLVDYEAVITVVDEAKFREAALDRSLLRTDDGVDLDADELLSMVGLARRIHENGLRRVLTFHTRVKNAERFAKYFPRIARWAFPNSDSFKEVAHYSISAATSAFERRRRMAALSSADIATTLVSNARVLTEGVDIPSVDAIAFIDPKNSVVDIVQAIGRALRLSPGKDLGHIVVVAPINPSEPIEDQIDANRLQSLWRVINALRAHDDRLAEKLDSLRTEIGRRKGARPTGIDVKIDAPWLVSSQQADAIKLKIIEEASENWYFNFGLLLRFIEENGHAMPETKTEFDGVRLGTWVYKQRKFFEENRLSEERVRKLESIPQWRWERPDDWGEKFGVLKRFSQKYGHCEIPKNFVGTYKADGVEIELKLHVWAGIQRGAYRNGSASMTAERTRSLEELNGWRWDPGEIPYSVRRKLRLNTLPLSEEFIRKVDALERYQQEFGITQVDAANRVYEGIDLYKWCAVRRQYHQRNSISHAEIERLEQVPGWTWDPLQARQEEWDKIFELNVQTVEKMVQEQGSLFWDSKAPGNEAPETGVRDLRRWLEKQRGGYRRQLLPPERARRLETIPGWTWDYRAEVEKPPSKAFMERVFLVTEWVHQSQGRPLPTKRTVYKGVNIGKWISHRRTDYKDGRLTQAQIDAVETIPNWIWSGEEIDPAQRHDFLHKASLVRKYFEKYGTNRISQHHMPFEGVDIKGWVNTRRGEYRKGSLSPAQIAHLERIPGWRWSGRRAPS